MVTAEYKIAYSEVLEILKYISKDEFNKIPEDMIEMFKVNANEDNKFVYDKNKTLQEQNVSEIARTIIAILFRDYWATTEQREKILKVQDVERQKYLQKKYNTDNLFKRANDDIDETVQTQNIAMVEYKEPLLKRIISKIKSIFHIN